MEIELPRQSHLPIYQKLDYFRSKMELKVPPFLRHVLIPTLAILDQESPGFMSAKKDCCEKVFPLLESFFHRGQCLVMEACSRSPLLFVAIHGGLV